MKRKLILTVLPFILAADVVAPVASRYEKQDTHIEKTLRDNEVSVMVFLAFMIPIGGWIYSNISASVERQKEAGRQDFLTKATTIISDSVSERLVAKLNVLEERIEWVYKEITTFENRLNLTDADVSHIQVKLTQLTTDIQLLKVTRRQFIDRLNDQLHKAEGHLTEVIGKCRAVSQCEQFVTLIEEIEDPFDTKDDEALY